MATIYSIIAGAALQFIDFDLDLSQKVDGKDLALRRKPFYVDPTKDPAGGPGRLTALVKAGGKDEGEVYVTQMSADRYPMHYEVEMRDAFECCLGRWLPMPFLVQSGTWSDQKPRFAYGPTDWVRGFLSRLGKPEDQKYRLTLVFDPQVEDGTEVNQAGEEEGAVIYHALSQEDVINNVTFSLAADQRDHSWFVGRDWINEALRQSHEQFRQKNPRKRLSRVSEDFPNSGYARAGDSENVATEYLAVYSTFLEGLALTEKLGEIRLINPARAQTIEVDLVLDIGNSRLTGVLVETLPQRETRLTDCYILPVRDLSEPANIYVEPVSSQIEFVEPFFGQADLSLSSRQHDRSFPWPSTVRLGPEAARLAAESREDQGPTGMSSPKRYLWDTRQRDLQWFFNNKYERHGPNEERATGRGSFLMKVNEAGIPLFVFDSPEKRAAMGRKAIHIPKHIKARETDDTLVAFESRYSRSSLMMFLLSEITAQALSAINNPVVREGREHPTAPRRLSRIILTVPTAMPLVEQNIFKTWARLAVETVWSALGWDKILAKDPAGDDFRRLPTVRCDWDEATCTQAVWLYNEIRERFHNNAEELFKLLGQPRDITQGAESGKKLSTLRMASIDMGGGTTDLSIITYALHNPGKSSPLIKPHQEFREGFNVAGDDIMHKIIQTQFIRKIIQLALARGVSDAEGVVGDLFKVTPKVGVISDERNRECRRSQFVARAAVPIALKILKLYEGYDHMGEGQRESLLVSDLLPEPGTAGEGLESVLSYLEDPLRKAGWTDFKLMEQVLDIDLREVDAEVQFVLEKVMTDLAEVVKLYDCDVLILTGRPSRWPAMIQAPYRRICLPVDRIVHMHKYRVGARYPFVNHGKIEDPKTTVVIGAIICALAEGSLEGITIDTSRFVPQPTTRHLGILETKGRMPRELVWFADIDVDAQKKDEDDKRTVEFNAFVAIGFRQMACPRWTTTMLYSLEFKNAEKVKESAGCLPYTLELEYVLNELEEESDTGPSQRQYIKRTEGELKINSVTNHFGKPLGNDTIVARLQTLRSDSGYWLDTGVLGDD